MSSSTVRLVSMGYQKIVYHGRRWEVDRDSAVVMVSSPVACSLVVIDMVGPPAGVDPVACSRRHACRSGDAQSVTNHKTSIYWVKTTVLRTCNELYLNYTSLQVSTK